jgi:polyisoprenoid-binding protein YceI
MKQTKFPKIEYRLTELTLKETPKSADGPFNFDSKGALTLSGVTNQVSFPVTMTRADKTMKTTGSTTVKMTSFGIEPPGMVVLIKTGDDVKLTFEWVTSPSEAK